jgi:hypothetical protein
MKFILSDASDSVRVAALDSLPAPARAHPMAVFLRARALQRMGKDADALNAVSSIRFARADPLEAMRLQLEGRLLLRAGKPGKAKAAFWNSLNSMDHTALAALTRTSDWIDRSEWMQAHAR